MIDKLVIQIDDSEDKRRYQHVSCQHVAALN